MEAAIESQSLPATPNRGARAILSMGLPLAAGLALRLFALKKLFEVNGDSLIYGSIAKNLLLHGRYAIGGPDSAISSTLIRLPGYPLFLAACFRLFGMENYFAPCCIAVVLDLCTCLLIAGFVRRIVSPERREGASVATLWLAALCPFTASYTAFPLTETPTVFTLALAMWAMACFRDNPAWKYSLWFTFAVCAAALLRPDGALAAIALAPALVIGLPHDAIAPGRLRSMATVCIALALLPFAAWTWRNWRTFHIFQPLAPRLAIDPGEDPHLGWESWVKTWCLDYISTNQIYWNVPDDILDLNDLPSRAFDSPAQYAQTAALVRDYNTNGMDLTPDLDTRFAQLAAERIAAHPLRYYVLLPLGRVADMWLRPRVENLPIDLDWWVYRHHYAETRFSWAWAVLNALYLVLAIAGLCLRPRFWPALFAYMLLRSAMLLSVSAPEARYTLECFPMLFALGGVALHWVVNRVCLSVLKVKASFGSG
ncbi:MAG TPA: glycosyltransferase family 39 protein [Terracidiphilus sp.]|nr:glycosyltransferase family 39 protein [Terracidiphilus sp.]